MSYGEKTPQNYNQPGSIAAYGQQTYGQQTAPPPQTRFSSCAGQLEAHVSAVNSLFERVARSVDRLAGPVPEEAGNPDKIKGGANVASIIEFSLEDLGAILRRADRIVERLESL